MRLVYACVDGIKGQKAGFEIEKKNLALVGPMGSGKTSVIDGISLALNLPTRHGSKSLDRLSPTGQWSVALAFEGAKHRRLERRMTRRGAQFFVDGRKVTASDYAEAVRDIVDVEPHHCSLDSFLGLSGQKRAELFSQILQSNDTTDLASIIRDQTNQSIEDLFREELGDNLDLLGDTMESLGRVTGTAADIAEGVRQEANAARTREQDSKIRYEGLVDRLSEMSHGMTHAEIQTKLSAADEELGRLKGQQREIEAQRDQYTAAQKVVEASKTAAAAAAERVEKLEAKIAERAEVEAEHEKAKAALDRASDAYGKIDEEVGILDQRREKIATRRTEVTTSLKMAQAIEDADIGIDPEWVKELCRSTFGTTFEPDVLISFAMSVVTKGVAGGSVEELTATLAGIESELVAAKEQLAAARENLTTKDATMKELSAAIDAAARRLEAVEGAESEIDEAREAAGKADDERARVEQEASRVSVPADDEMLASQIQAAQEARDALATQQSELTERQAITGQVEEARLAVTASQATVVVLKRLVEIVQRARDAQVTSSLGEVMEPFRERFQVLFGDGVQVDHHSSGSGRSTEFYFTISRPGAVGVPLDLVSEGESVLTAAAFLSALQSIKEGPGSVLLLNDIGLDDRGCRVFAAGAPRLGLDFVGIASSRWDAVDEEFREGWQIVDMSSPPKVVR